LSPTQISARPPGPARLDGLQMLRFFAAASVLFVHTLHEALSFDFAGPQSAVARAESWNFGAGVDVFFVLSGFLMFYISSDSFGAPGAQAKFLWRRIVRLVPLYWLFTVAMLLAMVAVPGQLAHTQIQPAHALASFAFVPWLDATGLPHPILGLGWTLNYEMFFYLVFSFALLLPRRIGLTAIFALFAIFALINSLLDPSWVQAKFWSDPIIIEFLFGIGLAIAARRGWALPAGIAWAAIAFGLAGLALAPRLAGNENELLRVLANGIPAALMVAGAGSLRFARLSGPGRWLVLGGDASYALYLSHPFTINVMVLAWEKLHLGSPWAFAALTGVVAVAASLVIHVVLERPLTRYLQGLGTTRRSPVAIKPAE